MHLHLGEISHHLLDEGPHGSNVDDLELVDVHLALTVHVFAHLPQYTEESHIGLTSSLSGQKTRSANDANHLSKGLQTLALLYLFNTHPNTFHLMNALLHQSKRGSVFMLHFFDPGVILLHLIKVDKLDFPLLFYRMMYLWLSLNNINAILIIWRHKKKSHTSCKMLQNSASQS